MRVWLIQRAEPTPLDKNGSQRLLRMGILAQALCDRGHEVVWWTSTFDHYQRVQRYRTDTKVEITDRYSIQFLKGAGYSKNVSLARLSDNRLVAKRFECISKQYSDLPDIILASIPTAELALAACQYGETHHVPVLLDIRDLWPDVFMDIVPSIFRPIVKLLSMPMDAKLRKACRMATGITGLTSPFVNWATFKAGRQTDARDRVFNMGYMANEGQANEYNDAIEFWQSQGVGIDSSELIAIFFGAIGRTNDLVPIVETARKAILANLPVKFVICGKGENDDYIKSASKSLSNLVAPGWVNQEQIRQLLAVGHVGIAPYINSKNYTFNIPNKPAEYLSGNLAIALSLDTGELYNKIVKNQCGFTYNNDPNILLSKLVELIENPSILAKMRSNARHLFLTEFDGTQVYADFSCFLESVARS